MANTTNYDLPSMNVNDGLPITRILETKIKFNKQRFRRLVGLTVFIAVVVLSAWVLVTSVSPTITRVPHLEPPPPQFVAQYGAFDLSYVFGQPPLVLREAFEQAFEQAFEKASLFWSGVLIDENLTPVVLASNQTQPGTQTDAARMSFCGDRTLLDTWFTLPSILHKIQVGVRIMELDGTKGTVALTTPCAFEPMNKNLTSVSIRARGGVIWCSIPPTSQRWRWRASWMLLCATNSPMSWHGNRTSIVGLEYV
jgi:hypothetical protein